MTTEQLLCAKRGIGCLMCVFSVKPHKIPMRKVCAHRLLIFRMSKVDRERLNNLCRSCTESWQSRYEEPMLSDSRARLTTVLYSQLTLESWSWREPVKMRRVFRDKTCFWRRQSKRGWNWLSQLKQLKMTRENMRNSSFQT